jgi:aminoglycoside phosphotransferase (APT) family kinase protein
VADLEVFGDGHSGFNYSVWLTAATGRARYVLRLSPPGARIAGPADVGRQAMIMHGLGQRSFPVPPVLSWSSDPAVDERSFGLMELVDGEPFSQAMHTSSDHEIAERAVATARQLQGIEPSSVLPGESPREPLDELAVWANLLDRAVEGVRDPGGVLVRRLEATAPPPKPPVLVHGDFHYGNLLFRDGEVVAVLDWEIASVGDPLLDVGCLAVATIRRRYEPEPNPTGSVDLSTRALVELYGADPEPATWFVALSCFKYAAILAYNLSLHRRGKRIDPLYEELQGTMHGLVDDGLELCAHGIDAR